LLGCGNTAPSAVQDLLDRGARANMGDVSPLKDASLEEIRQMLQPVGCRL
jgi:hypothetical protein